MARPFVLRFLLLVLALVLSACAPAAAGPRRSASIEPLAISQRSSSPLDTVLDEPVPDGSAESRRNLADADDEAAVKRVIEAANRAQAEAFARQDPSLMQPTALGSYYEELVQINRDMAQEGVASIELLKIEWGAITVTGDTAEATTFETWRTDYPDGSGDEGRDRNVYTLVRDGSGWKIKADAHPDSQLDQPGGEPPSPQPSGSPAPSPSPLAPGARAGQSHNWSGYSATGGTFTAVSGTWTVPKPTGSAFGADAAWVGIGGVRSRDLIQAGTEQTVSPTGRVTYSAWIEMLPQASRPVRLRISPGDSVTVAITEQQEGTWLVSMKNNTTSQTFQATEQYKSSHSSAEWVQESPSGRRGVLPLSNFGSISFSAASAVKDGKTVNIAEAGGRAITMIDRGSQPIAQPSPLGPDGASFTVTRVVPSPASSPAASQGAARSPRGPPSP